MAISPVIFLAKRYQLVKKESNEERRVFFFEEITALHSQ